MKAAVLFGKEDVRISDIPEVPLGPGEVRLKIGAALTCGTDLKVYKRGYHARMIVPPAVFGHEMAGVLSEVHPSVGAWKPGDRVVVANSAPCDECYFCLQGQQNLCDNLLFLNGAYAESIVVPPRLVSKNLLKLGAGISFRDAALTEPLACVVQGVEDLRLQKGESVLVVGGGPIGLMFVVLSKLAGCEVTVAGRGEARLTAAKNLGADQVIDISREKSYRIFSPAGRGFDVVIEAVGLVETWEAAIQSVRKGGRVNLFGGCPAGSEVRLDAGAMHYGGIQLLASFHHTPGSIRRALQLLESGDVAGGHFVTGDCRLNELPALFRQMAAGNRAVKTHIVVE